MASTLSLKLTIIPDGIEDQVVIKALPDGIRKDLGNFEGSGFDLRTGVRDLDFRHGLVKYKPGEASVEVLMD